MHRDEIPPGTLYLLILKTLGRSGELHGYEIVESIQRISNEVLHVEEGSLYPALQRIRRELRMRGMARSAGITMVAMLSLALGIGRRSSAWWTR